MQIGSFYRHKGAEKGSSGNCFRQGHLPVGEGCGRVSQADYLTGADRVILD